MPDPIRVAVFAEDSAHAAFLVPMVDRVAESLEVSVATQILSAEGGRPRALSQFRAWQETAARERAGRHRDRGAPSPSSVSGVPEVLAATGPGDSPMTWTST